MVKTFFRVHITQYHTIHNITQWWHFQRVTNKEYWLIEKPYQTVFTLSQIYYQAIVNTFSRVWIDTWTDKEFPNGKFSTRSEKSKHAHIKQIILPSTILEFTSLHDWSLMALWKKMAEPSLPKRILVPLIQKFPKKFQIFPASSYNIRKEF